jgi:hypothetical protein
VSKSDDLSLFQIWILKVDAKLIPLFSAKVEREEFTHSDMTEKEERISTKRMDLVLD